jgi:hypothetical protein
MSEPGTSAPTRPTAAPKRPSAFAAGSILLVLAILVCGVFAGLAGKKIGNQHLEFVISFIFLGFVVIGIFALAWVDASTRGPDQGRPHH